MHPERTLLHVRQEYLQLATEAGDIAYRIACETEELQARYVKMKALNEEGAQMQAEAQLAALKKKTEEKAASPVAAQPEPVAPVAVEPEAQATQH